MKKKMQANNDSDGKQFVFANEPKRGNGQKREEGLKSVGELRAINRDAFSERDVARDRKCVVSVFGKRMIGNKRLFSERKAETEQTNDDKKNAQQRGKRLWGYKS